MENIQESNVEKRGLSRYMGIIYVLLFLLILTSGIFVSFFLKSNPVSRGIVSQETESIEENTEEEDTDLEIPEGKITEKYEVVNIGCELSLVKSEYCTKSTGIIPKAYTEKDREYLVYPYVTYFSKADGVQIFGQVDMISFDPNSKLWIYSNDQERVELEEKIYGENRVVEKVLSNSHNSWEYVIVSRNDSEKIAIVNIPISNRVRCDQIENIEKIQECNQYLVSLGISLESDTWVPENIYTNYFNDLKELIYEIEL